MGIPPSKYLPINCCLARHWSVYSFPSSRLRNCDVVPIRCAIMRCIRVHEFLPFKRWLWVHFFFVDEGWVRWAESIWRTSCDVFVSSMTCRFVHQRSSKNHQNRCCRSTIMQQAFARTFMSQGMEGGIESMVDFKYWVATCNNDTLRIIQIHTAYFNCNVCSTLYLTDYFNFVIAHDVEWGSPHPTTYTAVNILTSSQLFIPTKSTQHPRCATVSLWKMDWCLEDDPKSFWVSWYIFRVFFRCQKLPGGYVSFRAVYHLNAD